MHNRLAEGVADAPGEDFTARQFGGDSFIAAAQVVCIYHLALPGTGHSGGGTISILYCDERRTGGGCNGGGKAIGAVTCGSYFLSGITP